MSSSRVALGPLAAVVEEGMTHPLANRLGPRDGGVPTSSHAPSCRKLLQSHVIVLDGLCLPYTGCAALPIIRSWRSPHTLLGCWLVAAEPS